ncbi:transposase, partial [Pyrenophora tritici-repentis]
EDALKAYITRCDALYMPPLIPQLISAAQRILDLEHPDGKAPPIGKNWISRWLARNPDCRRKKQKKQEIKRLAANTVEVYERHFAALKRAIDEYAIQPGDLYIMDETDIRMGAGGQQYVITMAGDDDAVQSPSDTNRESVTVVETVAADGSVLAPFIILKGKAHLSKWHTNTKLPDDYIVAVSETAYNNDELSLEWIRHFDAYSC